MERFGEVLKNVCLKKYNTYNVGGNAKYLVKPFNINSLIELIKHLKKENYKYFIIGKGSNIILPDEDYDGVVIILDKLKSINYQKSFVTVESGCSLNIFINDLISNNYKGLENLYGIPGTIGGAIVQNAGCYGNNISDYLISVTYLENDQIYEIKKEDCNFKYRYSLFKDNKDKIILSCKFILNKGNKEEMLEIIKNNMIKRKNNQPLEYPNAGSVFRNPENISAGKLIEDNNLKGFNINGAYVSNKHANFIINKDNASSKDIIELIEYIKNTIYENEKIELILEQEIIKY